MPLRLVRRKGSPHWYMRGSIRLVSIFESTGLSDFAAAEEVLAIRQAEIVRESIHGHSAVRTFADAALSYQEAGGERKHIAPLLKHFGQRKLASIGQHEIDEAAKKLKPGASPSTLNRHVYTPAAAVLHHAARKKWCDHPVIARPKEPKGRVRWITQDEAARLVDAAAPHIKPLVIFLLATGARLSEALYLQWRDVDLSRAHVTFLDTKNGENRGIPLHPRAVAALANLPHRTGAVFRSDLGGVRWNGKVKPVGPGYGDRGGKGGGQIKTAWNAMLKRAGISDFTPHDCRHTWATWHYAANRDITALMELGGWKSPAMVIRYAHVNTSHLAGSINAIWVTNATESVQSPDADNVKPFPAKA